MVAYSKKVMYVICLPTTHYIDPIIAPFFMFVGSRLNDLDRVTQDRIRVSNYIRLLLSIKFLFQKKKDDLPSFHGIFVRVMP